MGVPSRSWRAMLRPDRSWISRGLLGLGAMIGTGFLYVVALAFGDQLGINPDSGLVAGLKFVSAAFTVVVMCYQGFAMSHSTAIGIWNSAIIPMASLLYSLALGVAGAIILLPAGQASGLLDTQLLLLLGLVVMHTMLLHGAWHGSPGARTSVELLLQTNYSKWFWGTVIGAGIALPALLIGLAPSNNFLAIISGVAMLAGFSAWRVLIFKVGVYEPILSMNPFHSTS